MRHKNILYTFILIISAVLSGSGNSHLYVKGEIYAIGCIDNYPYEYLDDSGNPAGFSVDLINSISNELKLSCRIDLVPYQRFIYLKNNPDVDIILGMVRGSGEPGYKFFRTNVKIHFSLFSNSDSEYSSINDLQYLKILVTANELLAHQIQSEIQKFVKVKPGISNNEINAFTSLKKKDYDAVFMAGISARKLIDNKNLIGIREVPVNTGFFDYGFGVRKNKNGIHQLLTEGYNNVFTEGEYQAIYSKWFVEKSGNSFFNETGIYLSAGIFCFLIFILFILINSFVLRRRIREKTGELNYSMNELNKAQVRLRESEKRFRRIFDKSPSGLLILNPEGRVLIFNEAFIQIFGVINPDEIKNLDVINSPLSTEWFKTRLKNYHDVHMEIKFDFQIVKETKYFNTSKTGMMILELIVIPVEINSGTPEPGFMCQFSDNTKEKQLLDEIIQNKSKLEQVFEAVKDGLWEWNLESNKVRYNRKFFSFLGYKMESYQDNINTLFGFIHESDRESVRAELYEKISNGRNFNIEYRMVMGNGKIITVRSRGETIEWNDNLKPLRVIGTQTEVFHKPDISSRLNNHFIPEKMSIGLLNDLNCNHLSGRNILIVDDNYLIYLHISELLKKYDVKSLYAATGIEAIEILKAGIDIHLIVLDQFMPGLDGLSSLKEIRKINKDMPVLLQTGQVCDSMHQQFRMDGFNGVLGKPVEENLLIETIGSIFKTVFYSKN